MVARPSAEPRLNITINGRRTKAATTRSVVSQILKSSTQKFEIEVSHSCQVPVGVGFGASGAGAVGAAHALSRSLGLSLSPTELLTIAHVAEVTCHTGLGDVGAQNTGGLVMGMRPGAPPWGKWKRVPLPRDVRVLCCTLGPIQTSRLLQKADFRKRAKTLGISATRKLLREPTPSSFMKVSKEFSEKLGLVDDELQSLVEGAERAGAIGASQMMLGRAVFALAKKNKVNAVRRGLLELSKPDALIISGISRTGVKLLQR